MTTAPLIPERMERFRSIKLLNGSHETADDGMCVMEAVAYIAGEPHTDHPKCACPIITSFMISWNDSVVDDGERTSVIGPLVPLIVGTKATKEIENRRVFMCMDWSIQTFTPDWLDFCGPQYATHTAALRLLPEIADWQGLINATPILVYLRKLAYAARAASGYAAGYAALDAARAASGYAAGDALKPIKEKLQISAANLVRRMCELS